MTDKGSKMLRKEQSPWSTMWFDPRGTMRSVANKGIHSSFFFLLMLFGWASSLQLVSSSNAFAVMSTFKVLLMTLLMAPFIGGIIFALLAFLFWSSGKLLKGKASFFSMLLAVSWSHITSIVTFFAWFLLLILFKDFAFGEGRFLLAPVGLAKMVITALFLAQNIFTVWTLILLVASVAEVQKLSIPKAIANILLPFVILFALLWVASTLVN